MALSARLHALEKYDTIIAKEGMNMNHLVVLTAACGVGKSTVRDTLERLALLPDWACMDVDSMGINWWDYAGTAHEGRYTADCLAEAIRRAGEKHVLFVCCASPMDVARIPLPEEIASLFLVGMGCSAEEIARRLKARPAERMCSSDEFIAGQAAYNAWLQNHAELFNCFIDNTMQTPEETAREIAAFVLAQA